MSQGSTDNEKAEGKLKAFGLEAVTWSSMQHSRTSRTSSSDKRAIGVHKLRLCFKRQIDRASLSSIASKANDSSTYSSVNTSAGDVHGCTHSFSLSSSPREIEEDSVALVLHCSYHCKLSQCRTRMENCWVPYIPSAALLSTSVLRSSKAERSGICAMLFAEVTCALFGRTAALPVRLADRFRRLLVQALPCLKPRQAEVTLGLWRSSGSSHAYRVFANKVGVMKAVFGAHCQTALNSTGRSSSLFSQSSMGP